MSEYDDIQSQLKAWAGFVSSGYEVPAAGGTMSAAAAAIEALVKERDDAKRKLFPYAEDKEISGVTWNGFYLIGNRKSVDEFKRLENRAAQLETYRAEFVRRNEAAEAEVERLKGVLGKIADGDAPREAVTIWRSDGIHSKHDKCGHERVMYDDCDNCTSEFARSALEAKP